MMIATGQSYKTCYPINALLKEKPFPRPQIEDIRPGDSCPLRNGADSAVASASVPGAIQ